MEELTQEQKDTLTQQAIIDVEREAQLQGLTISTLPKEIVALLVSSYQAGHRRGWKMAKRGK